MDVLREPEYMAHVQAMTAEGLHSKADIAAELAVRDIRIRDLEAALRDAREDDYVGGGLTSATVDRINALIGDFAGVTTP